MAVANAFGRRKARFFIYHVGCICLLCIVMYPLVWLVMSSFKDSVDIFQNPSSLIPKKFTLVNYKEGWRGFGGISFGVFFSNSILVTTISTVASVVSSVIIGYGFSRIKFNGRGIWFVCMLLTMMLPAQVLLIPQYVLFSKFNWINTYLPLIIPKFFGVPFFIFLSVQFIRSIPKELDDSATVDGLSNYGIFARIILPLLKPVLFTSGIFAFYWSWNDFITPLIYLNNIELYTVSVALKLFSDPNSVTNWGAIYAMSTLSLVPCFILFFAFQKNIVEGISTTGIKG